VRLLAELGIDQVFGIPGVHTLEMFRGLAYGEVAHLLNRSEQGAVLSADGYARTTGRPGVALLISGPGVTNAATAVAQAYHDSIPLLVIASSPTSASLGAAGGALHEMPDQRAFMAAITASSTHVDDPEALPEVLAGALELFESARPRPVYIQIPEDTLARPAPALRAHHPRKRPPSPSPESTAAAVRLLAQACRPLIILGGGAVGAGSQAALLAERIQSPIVHSLNAKGAVPDAHPLSLGTALPTPAIMHALAEADVVLAVGTEFSELDYYYAEEPLRFAGALIRLDIDERQLQAKHWATVALHADSREGLQQIHDGLRALPERPSERRDGVARAAALRAEMSWCEEAQPLMGVVQAISDGLPEDALVAVEANQLAYVGQNLWPAGAPRSWMIPAGWASLGPALPMAIGAAVGRPGAPVVAVVGDGGLLFTIGEMATACQYELPLTLLLWNNHGYGEMRDQMDKLEIGHVGTEGTAHDFAAIAAGFGWRVHKPIDLTGVSGAVAQATTCGCPSLVELAAENLT
jgi:acetolactate synthase I/II/III large subunit